MKKQNRTVMFLAIVGLLGGALTVTSCGSKAEDPAAMAHMQQLEVKTQVVKKGAATVEKIYTASLEGKINVEVRAQATGYIDRILVEEGSYVKKGQVLMLIDGQPYQIQLNNAEAALKAAQAALDTAKIEQEKVAALLENAFVSPIQLKTAQASVDNAKASVAQAQAAVAEAKLNLSYTRITAPVDGFLGRITKRVGNLVTAGEPEALTTMSDISQMFAYFSMSEGDYYDMAKEGGVDNFLKVPVTLALTNGEEYTQPGKIDLVNGEFDRTTNAISVRAVFENPERLLRNGGTGTVVLKMNYDDLMQVPIAATVDIQDKIFVFVLTKDNTVEQRQLKIQGKTLHTYFIDSGVEEGETIVITGVDKLQDGMTVTPLAN